MKIQKYCVFITKETSEDGQSTKIVSDSIGDEEIKIDLFKTLLEEFAEKIVN